MTGSPDVVPASNLLQDPAACRRVLECLDDRAVVTVDSSERITGWSRAAEALLGYPQEAVLGRPLSDLRGEGGAAVWVRRSGETLGLEVVSHDLRGESGRPEGAVLLLRARSAEEERVEALLAQFRAVCAATADHIYLFDPDGRYRFASAAGARALGWTPEEMVGRSWRDLGMPRGRMEAFDAERSRVQETGERRTGEIDFPTVEGLRAFEYVLTPVLEEGRVVGTVATVRDITERRRIEAAFREGERRFRAIFDTAAIGISLADLRGHPVTTNAALQRMLGYDGDELRAMAFPEFTHPDDLEVGLDLFAQLVAGDRESYQVEKRYIRKDRAIFWARLSTSLVRQADGTPEYVIGMIEDISDRRAAEGALQESEARFRATFDRAGVGMVLADAEGRFLRTNPRFQQLLGYRAEELEGMRFTEVTWPEDIDLDWALFRELRAGERDAYEIEKRYLRKDGTVVWGRLIGSLVQDDEGAYRFGIGMVEDITDRKEIEEARNRLIAILEATPDTVGIIDGEGQTVYLNQAGRRHLGLGLTEDVSHRVLRSYHPDRAASLVLREGLPTAAREGIWHGESALLGADGHEIPVSQVILAHYADSGEVRFFSTVMRDLTERIHRDTAQRFLLAASRALSGSLDLERTLEVIVGLLVPERGDYCLIDLMEEGGIQRVVAHHWDPAKAGVVEGLRRHPVGGSERLGVSEVLRTGESLRVAEVTEPWLRAVSKGDDHLRLLRALEAVSEMIVPLRARGTVIGAVTLGATDPGHFFTDEDLILVEELCGRAGLALDNARLFEDAQRATALRDDVLRVVAHDLRNPIVTIALGADMLSRALPEGQEAARIQLDAIRRSVETAERLLHDLLDVGRMEAGRLPIEPTPQPASALLEEAAAHYGALAADRGIDLQVEDPGELPLVRADRHRILQVFSNLIGNALRFTPAGGGVTLRARQVGAGVRFEVQDTGSGISEEGLPRLFEPFWQATAARGTGVGLGLPIVRGIVEAHQGTVDVETRVGEGTTIAFVLPAADPT